MKIICYRYRQRKPRYGGISSKNILSGKECIYYVNTTRRCAVMATATSGPASP